jgi:hypothetical protein
MRRTGERCGDFSQLILESCGGELDVAVSGQSTSNYRTQLSPTPSPARPLPLPQIEWHRRLSSNSSSFRPLRALSPTRETDVRLFCRPIALVCVPSKGTRQRKLCCTGLAPLPVGLSANPYPSSSSRSPRTSLPQFPYTTQSSQG